MKHQLHVSQPNIRHNIQCSEPEAMRPVLINRTYKGTTYGNKMLLKKNGKIIGKLVYRPHKPLSCGARVWFEFDDKDVQIEVIS